MDTANANTSPLSNISQMTSPLPSQVQSSKNFKEFLNRNKVKLILGVLAIIVLVEIILGVRMLFSPVGEVRITPTQIKSLSPAEIVLVSSNKSYKTGEKVPVEVRVVTGGNLVDSTDVILHFDPAVLTASTSSIRTGKIYGDYPVAAVDSKEGLIKISGTNLNNSPGFSGIGSFASVDFIAKAFGNTAVSVEFEKGATADSNVVLSGSADDTLEKVYNLNINIGNSSQSSQSNTSAVCDGYTQYCLTGDGKTGTQICSAGRKDGGSCVFDPLLTVSCSVCKM